MAKRIRKHISIQGEKKWFTGENELEVILKVASALVENGALTTAPKEKHNFREYATNWFTVYCKPNIAEVTAITYERQLKNHIYPALGDKDLEDITTQDVQEMFNAMRKENAKSTKTKVKNVLNMIFEQALEEGLMQRNPLRSKNLRIVGAKSQTVEPYSVEQMCFLASQIGNVQKETDRNFLALLCVHPLRPEEALGLRGKDVDLRNGVIHIRQVVTHPDRNKPIVKEPKTEESKRDIELVTEIIPYLTPCAADAFFIGGEAPLTYQQVKRACERIRKDICFPEKITPRRFRPTVLTDLYAQTKDIKMTQYAAGHTTAAMTLKHYVNGRSARTGTAASVASAYGLSAVKASTN